MKILPITQIQLHPDRQRQVFVPEDHQKLVESIVSLGLFHAPVIQEIEGTPWLVAGERRLKAIQDIHFLGLPLVYNNNPIPPDHAPFVTLGEITPLEAQEAELDENIRRLDLTWQERTRAISKLHKLRSAQALADGTTQSITQTCEELQSSVVGRSRDLVRKAILIADKLDDPAISGATSIDEAFKILKRQEQSSKHQELAQQMGPKWSIANQLLIQTDCIEWMAQQPSHLFDAIITDPPYGINAQEFGSAGGKLEALNHSYDDSSENFQRLMELFFPLAFRLAKPQAHLYLCCDIDKFHDLRLWANRAGWRVHRTPLVYHKPNATRVPWPDHGPRRHWELILYAMKGAKPTNGIFPDLISVTSEEPNHGHAAEKPIALYADLLARSCRPGDRILDSFAGTATALVACHAAKVFGTALEISPEFYGLGIKRLEELL